MVVVEEIRRKIRPPGIKPAFLRRLGPYVTKEKLESIYQKIVSVTVTHIFREMLLFPFFSRKMRQADRRRRLRATITTKRHLQMAPRTTQTMPSPPLLALFVLLGFRLGIRARVVITHAARGWWQARWRERRRERANDEASGGGRAA